MTKNDVIIVKPENILAQYFRTLLENGITQGITVRMYNELVDELVRRINSDTSEYCQKIKVERTSFKNIVQEVNERLWSRAVSIKLKNTTVNGKKTLIALPTYELKRWGYDKFKTGLYGRQEDFLEEIMKEKMKSQFITPGKKFISKRSDIAKKVASFFVNDLIERYVKSQINEGHWPSQCGDIDKYIFDRDIGKYIDVNGTAEIFKMAYLHAIDGVDLLLENNKKEAIQISNDPYYMLAHANFLKLIMKEELAFLKQYIHHEYTLNDSTLIVTISSSEVLFKSNTCTFSDPYEEWSDEYETNKGTIGMKSVEIMEKRIGKVN